MSSDARVTPLPDPNWWQCRRCGFIIELASPDGETPASHLAWHDLVDRERDRESQE